MAQVGQSWVALEVPKTDEEEARKMVLAREILEDLAPVLGIAQVDFFLLIFTDDSSNTDTQHTRAITLSKFLEQPTSKKFN